MMPIAMATEDEVSEAVGQKLVSELLKLSEVALMPLRKNGFGYLRSRMDSWRQMAEHQIVIVLTDLDKHSCPVALRDDWYGDRPVPKNLLLRIAVREIEAWLLADHEALNDLIGKRQNISEYPDNIPDPKQCLLKLAQSAHRSIRDDLVRTRGSAVGQGIGYNNRIANWVQHQWSPARAATRSPSLCRARDAIRAAVNRGL